MKSQYIPGRGRATFPGNFSGRARRWFPGAYIFYGTITEPKESPEKRAAGARKLEIGNVEYFMRGEGLAGKEATEYRLNNTYTRERGGLAREGIFSRLFSNFLLGARTKSGKQEAITCRFMAIKFFRSM